MDLENIMLSKIRQTEKDKYCMISLMYDLNNTNKLKNDRNECICKTDSRKTN